MKNTIKTVTLTLDELNKIVADSAAGNVDAANGLIATKVRQKEERLRRQRERRRLKQKPKAAKSEKPKDSSSTITLILSKELAKCILWLHNRRDALKSNVGLLVREIARSKGVTSPSLQALEEAIKLILHLSSVAAREAHDHLHAKYRMRPLSVTLNV